MISENRSKVNSGPPQDEQRIWLGFDELSSLPKKKDPGTREKFTYGRRLGRGNT
jgi:hypothetical protein